MFTIHYNKNQERDKRRFLRNNPTRAEKRLWQFLRKKQVMGYKFRRQYGIDAYAVDFYCPAVKLAIEIDGEIHKSREVRFSDKERQEYLEQYGIFFLRFSNQEVENGVSRVISRIAETLKHLEGKR